MPTTFGAFRNDGDDGDDGDLFRNDGDDGDDGDRMRGARPTSLLAQALENTRDYLKSGFPTPQIGNPAWTDQPLDEKDIFGRWSRDVRAHLYSFELLTGTYFQKGANIAILRVIDIGNNSSSVVQTISVERPKFDWDKTEFEKELRYVMDQAGENRKGRLPDILAQVQVPYPFFARLLNLQPGRHRHTSELMSAVFRFSSTVVMQFKNHLKVRRPADRSPLVQPMLPTPGHGSYPAGHATQCHFAVAVLQELLKGKLVSADMGTQLELLADRIAENRIIAGLHYRPDNCAGKKLGKELAKHFLRRKEDPGSALNWLWTKASMEWDNI